MEEDKGKDSLLVDVVDEIKVVAVEPDQETARVVGETRVVGENNGCIT